MGFFRGTSGHAIARTSDGASATRHTGFSGRGHHVGEVAKGKGLEVNGPNVWSDGIAANQGSRSGGFRRRWRGPASMEGQWG
jgi:hypothetical protein